MRTPAPRHPESIIHLFNSSSLYFQAKLICLIMRSFAFFVGLALALSVSALPAEYRRDICPDGEGTYKLGSASRWHTNATYVAEGCSFSGVIVDTRQFDEDDAHCGGDHCTDQKRQFDFDDFQCSGDQCLSRKRNTCGDGTGS